MIQRTVLPNGLRVLLLPEPKSPTATALILVEAGSEYETKAINGISHFLEHLVFKGTKKRPTAAAISSELDGLGAQYNAFTSQEYTGYWAKVQSHKITQALDLISDMYLNPVIDPAEMEKERGVIIEEINMIADDPRRQIHDDFSALLYGDQPAGWNVAGEKAIINRITKEQVVSYRTLHYHPAGTVVVVSGGFSPAAVRADIKKYFSALPRHPKVKKPATIEKQSAPRLAYKKKDSDQTHLVLGVRAFDMFDPRRYAAQVLADIVGGGMSSRLFQKIREEMGAAYYVGAGVDLDLDHGVFGVSCGVERSKLVPVVRAVIQELNTVSRTPVAPSELRKTKDHLIGNFLINLESSDEIASFYGMQEVAGQKIKNPAQIIKAIEAVSAAQVRDVARDIFKDKTLNFASIGRDNPSAALKKALRFG